MRPWRRKGARRVERCGIFDLDHVEFEPPDGGAARPFYVLDCPDWVNVIAITPGREVLLVRQFRFGIAAATLEIPGGMCDAGEGPREAASRELREETGYAAGDLVELGWVHPNPPIQTNRCWTYLATDARPVGPPSPDAHEAFELLRVPLDDVPAMIGRREITHGLVLAAFHLHDVHRARS